MQVTFLFIVAVVGTVALFLFWLVVSILRGLTRLILGPPARLRPPQLPPQMPIGNVRPCGRISCRALNPVEARFCRRCGASLQEPQNVRVRRAAIF
jgi:hypothetical protein